MSQLSKTISALVLMLIAAGVTTAIWGRPSSTLPGKNSDLVIYDISTQTPCVEIEEPATFNLDWTDGLSTEVDQLILGGDIIAYQIQWFNGNWSKWFVVGVNDIDLKFNIGNNTMRRTWSYFFDHNHRYIICKD